MTRENAAGYIGTDLSNETMPLAPELAVMMKEEVDRTKDQKLPVNRAFEIIAKKSGLKFNTVRNYYYRYIHEKGKNGKYDNNSKRSRNKVKRGHGIAGNSFKESEVKSLVMTILQSQAKGESVRSCANRLANNDPKLMLRYQNKYRNIIANQPEYVKALMEEMDSKGIAYYDPFRKVFVNSMDGQDGKRDDLQYQNPETIGMNSDSGEDLLMNVGQLMVNMREIDGESLGHFFKGLRELSMMAVQWKKHLEQSGRTGDSLSAMEGSLDNYRDILKEKDWQIQELNAKILSYEMRLEEQKKKIARLMSMFHQLMSVNRSFLNLSSAGKLSGLHDYTKELESLVKGYDAEIAD